MALVRPLGIRRGFAAIFVVLAGASLSAAPSDAPGRVRLENGELRLESGAFRIRGVGYDGATPCLYTRDLPLLATMGANVVRTHRLLPEGDRAFAPALESTGLYWLADFPLDGPIDHATVLDAFRRYASRFRGQRRLIGYVLGAEAAPWAADFEGVLREIEPDRPPLLARATPGGLAFGKVLTPVIDEDGLRALDRAEPGPGLIYSSFSGSAHSIFESTAVTGATLDTLKPRAVYYTLASLWAGSFPAAWSETAPPRLGALEDGSLTVSPGALVRIGGRALLHPGPPYTAEEWPFHLGEVCLCVGGAPARLNFVSSTEVGAQIPSGLEPGERTVVLFRGGAASNPITLEVRQFTAGAPPGRVLEARLPR